MNAYRERLELSDQLAVFEKARSAGNREGMAHALRIAKFTEPEIESILWSNGDFTPVGETKEKDTLGSALAGRLAIALVSGLLLGGTFVYFSSGLNHKPRSGDTKLDSALRDYRSPTEAYYRPFVWGFVIGAVGGFVTGSLVYDPTSNSA